MARPTFDLDILRRFVTGIELGSFAKAADRLGRSTSAVSAQLKKLEEQVGVPILQKAGRGLALTAAGETLLGYARRLLLLNDEAVAAVRGTDLTGSVRIGVLEDLGQHLLPRILGSFSRAHPRVRIETRIARNVELVELINTARLDLALCWESADPMPFSERLAELPMCWIGAADALPPTADEPLPLVVFEAPCLMRSAATAALDRAGRAWRIACSSASLGGIWAAVGAGLGITVRTRAGLPASLVVCDGYPPLPPIGLTLLRSEAESSPVVRQLADMVRLGVRDAVDEFV